MATIFESRRGLICMLGVTLTASVLAACGSGVDSSAKDDDIEGSEPTLAQVEQAVRAGCAPESFAGKISRAGTDQVDLLIVVDQSASMREELESLAEKLPKLAESLTSGDTDGDGEQDILPVQSLRVAIATSDLGTPVPNIRGCEFGGEAGNLLSTGDGHDYFEYQAGEPLESFDTLSALVASLGTDGCGFEQPFEATLAALTGKAAYEDVGGGWPAPEPTDFLRERSVLGVLLVTDEDDCSALLQQEMFNPASSDARFADEGLNIRCGLHADDEELLRSVDNFVTRLKALREGIEPRIVFGAFAGVPTGTTKTPSELLDDPAMAFVPNGDPSSHNTIAVPACESERGLAAPARRITQAAAAFGDFGIVQSICDDDPGLGMERTFEKLATSFEPLPTCE